MKKVLAILFTLMLCLSFSACSPTNHIVDSPYTTSIGNSEETDLSTINASANVQLSTAKTLPDYLEKCESAVKVEIVEVEELYEFNVRYHCRVIEDYFDNINYQGMEDGYISVYDSCVNYDVGDLAYMFLKGKDYAAYPHIVYLQLNGEGYVDTKLVDNVPIPVTNDVFSSANVYGLQDGQNLEDELQKFAAKSTKKAVGQSVVSSYSDMADTATEAWLIRIDSIVTDVDYGKYTKGFDCEILEVYRTGTGAVPGLYSREAISIDRPIEVGGTYLYFKGEKDGVTQAISKEYCLLQDTSPVFAKISTTVTASSY